MPNPAGINQYTKGGGVGKRSGSWSGTTQKAGGGRISKSDAAAIMFGRGSKQHKKALKRFSKS